MKRQQQQEDAQHAVVDPHPSSTSSTTAATVRRRNDVRTLRRRDGLLRFARNVTSQHGEDGILDHLFASILRPTSTAHRFLVDVGAWDGRHWSNTYSLLNAPNAANASPWRGILVEAHTDRFHDLQELYRVSSPNVVCLNRTVSAMPDSPNGLPALLHEHSAAVGGLPSDFDFLCVDVDGSDYWLWSNLLHNDNRWRPKVVCIEFNPTMPDDLIYIPPQSDSIRHGASLAALVELAHTFDYELVETTLYNAFFVVRELYEQHLTDLVPDTSIEALHQVTMGTALYQLYDGTLKLHGCKKLLWHRLPLDEAQMQALPPHQRIFPLTPPSPSDATLTWDDSDVVDVSAWARRISGGALEAETDDVVERRRACSDRLLDRLLRQGFCHVRGTGLDSALCRDALERAEWFLHRADEVARRDCLAQDRARRGYSPTGTENFASLLGEVAANDLVKKFRMGSPRILDRPNEVGSSTLWQPNVWPAPHWKGSDSFRTTMEAYFEAANGAALCVVQAICAGLMERYPDLATSLRPLVWPEEDMTYHEATATTSILTLLGYAVGSRHKGKHTGPLVAPHTDVGVLTFLLFDDGNCATLQRHRDGHPSGSQPSWVDVTLPPVVPSDPIFVVNVADCLSELSGGRLPSTLHRVAAVRPGTGGNAVGPLLLRPRTCCALFVGLQPHQTLQIQGETLTYEEWRKRRINRALSVLKGRNEKMHRTCTKG